MLDITTESLGVNIFTIAQLDKVEREFALQTYKQRKRDEFWLTKPMLDEASEEAMLLEFEHYNSEFNLIEELLQSNTLFDKDGLIVLN